MNNHQPFPTIGEEGYLHLLKHILEDGYKTRERTGTGTLVSPTPHQLHFPNVAEQFPLFTTKYVSFNMLACEMLWFISGETNANRIEDIGSHAMHKMWLKWADDYGELGPVYGFQWRNWISWKDGSMIDQFQNAIDMIKNNPTSRRIIVSAWNPSDIEDMALPPCHLMYQFTCEPLSYQNRLSLFDTTALEGLHASTDKQAYLDEENIPKYKLHLHMTQRSCDMFLGVPFNVAQYALLLQLIAQVTNTLVGGFTWTGVNCHIYQNHVEAVKEQLGRDIKQTPRVFLNEDINNIDSFTRDDMELRYYNPHPKIEAEVSI